MEKFMGFMERYLVPVAAKFGAQRHLVAVRDGFVGMIPIAMIGAFGSLMKNLPLKPYQNFLGSTTVGGHIATLGGNLWWESLALMSLFLVVSVAYALANSYKANALQAGLIALCSFLILSPQVMTVAPEGGEAIVGWGAIPWTYVSTNGLFTAMVVALVSTELFVKLSNVSALTIKMPDSVPPAVSRSFAKLLPGLITITIMAIVGIIVATLSDGKFINDLLQEYLAKPLTGVADSLGGAIFVAIFVHVLWIFGLHGANIALPVVEPILLELGGRNVELAAKGATEGYHVFAGALVSTELFVKLSNVSALTIKMPDSVPPAVSRSFAKLLPGLITITIMAIVGIIVATLSDGKFINDLLQEYLAKPLTGVADSLGGAIFVAIFVHVLWIFGLHGANIALPVVEPILLELGGRNVELAAKGATEGYHVFAGAFLDAFVYLGGSGMIIGLVIALLIAGRRRKDMIALGGPPALFNINEPMIFGMPIVLNPIYMIPFVLAPIICVITSYLAMIALGGPPALFNINEPMIFGMPIVLNPIYMIPFVLAPIICVITSYLAISSGLVPPVIMPKIPWITPPIFSGFIATGSIKGAILAAVNIVISVIVYLPFVAADERMAKKQLEKNNA